MMEITTIGAGGGSIAHVDAGGLLAVGPESAGSRPGPACYGAGNTRPTLTDANVVLGRINAERPIGGALARLDIDAARSAIETHVGKPLGLGTEAAAEAIVRVANAKMAGAIRLVSVERGHDPARFTARAFRRRRRTPCGLADPRRRSEGGSRAALSWHHLRARLHHRRHSQRSGRDDQFGAGQPRRCGARCPDGRFGQQSAGHRRRRPVWQSNVSTCTTSSTCTMSGRPTPSASLSP